MLKKILSNKNTVEGIVTNFYEEGEINKSITLDSIESVMSEEKECSRIQMNYPGVVFEYNVHYSSDTDEYLLEARVFDDIISSNPGGLLSSFLMVYDNNLVQKDEYVDDVWDYADWEKLGVNICSHCGADLAIVGLCITATGIVSYSDWDDGKINANDLEINEECAKCNGMI